MWSIIIGRKNLNFNSHAHVERDFLKLRKQCECTISTHTLTWSVTRYKIMKITGVKNFNSHAHVERDDRVTDFDFHAVTFQLTRSRGA